MTLRSHITHIRALALSAHQPASLNGFGFLTQSSPLEEFHVYLLHPAPVDFDDYAREGAVAHRHTDLSTGTYKGLRPQVAIASNLRSLKFTGAALQIPGTVHISNQAIYESLRAMPQLETLSLEHALKITFARADEVVWLPNLTYLNLEGPGEVVAAFYSSIQPHTHAIIGLRLDRDINLNQGEDRLVHLENIAATLRSHVQCPA